MKDHLRFHAIPIFFLLTQLLRTTPPYLQIFAQDVTPETGNPSLGGVTELGSPPRLTDFKVVTARVHSPRHSERNLQQRRQRLLDGAGDLPRASLNGVRTGDA